MSEEQFDKLTDEATHAVFNLIPAAQLGALSADQREGLMVQLNDYITEALSLFRAD
jgi:hypothetical protein